MIVYSLTPTTCQADVLSNVLAVNTNTSHSWVECVWHN